MSDEQFEQLARRIVWLTLAAAGVGACGGNEPPKTSAEGPSVAPVDVPVAEPSAAEPTATAEPPASPPSQAEKLPEATPQGERCRPDGGVNVLAGLHPAKPVDYVAVFQTFGKGADTREGQHVGTPCTGAADERVCNDALKAQKPTQGFRIECRPGYCAHGVAYTRGNEVGLASSIDELKAFLGPIDTEGEAILMAWAEGHNVGTCDELKAKLKQTAGGYELTTEKMTADCPIEISEFKLKVTEDGAVNVVSKKVKSKSGACVGRQSAGVALGPVTARDPRGKYFAECAQLERAAVIAFERMAQELAALGAPEELLRAASRSKQDEERHVVAMEQLSAKFQGKSSPFEAPSFAPRGAFEVARENAVEGCVRESYGALVGLWQCERAVDPEVRAALREVAQDELRHAALSWRVAAWLEPRLSPEQREAIASAKREAFSDLMRDCAAEPDAGLVETAGLPDAAHALGLAGALGAHLGLA